ncbi:MAG: hypothetical protein IPJ79_18610 [Bacteroidetes bacterium]|nr:hypothetical protein [Bacteroidota bacterium]
MKNTILNYLLALVLLFAGCKKNDDNSSSSNGNSSSYISTSLVSKTDSSAVIKASIQLLTAQLF